MLALLGSLAGFVGSAIPEGVRYFEKKQANTQALELLRLQIEAKKHGHIQNLEELNIKAIISERDALLEHDKSLTGGSKLIQSLRASVRPVATYTFILLFATIKITALYKFVSVGGQFLDGLLGVWDPETQSIFSAILSFWFGQRSIAKIHKED